MAAQGQLVSTSEYGLSGTESPVFSSARTENVIQMDNPYRIEDTSEIITPALVIFREVLSQNLDGMLRIAKSPLRLRPHCKTHKMPEVVRMELDRGIVKHKSATLAEAEMLAEAGAPDIVLAYPLVGPNIQRAVRFKNAYPEVQFAVIVDHARPAGQLAAAMSAAGQRVGVLLDLDTGQHRTGIAIGSAAEDLYRFISQTDGLVAEGLHVYDGQNHQTDRAERQRGRPFRLAASGRIPGYARPAWLSGAANRLGQYGVLSGLRGD